MKTFSTPIYTSFVAIAFFSSVAISAQSTDSIATSFKKIQPLPPSKKYLSAKSLIIPVVLIDYGFASLKSEELQELNKNIAEEVTEDCNGFNTKVDDYLKYAPIASVYLLNAAGIKGRHRILGRTIILGMSSILADQVVTFLKHSTHQLRPDGSTYNSFPSGHTTTAFIGAEMMNQEFGWRSPWYSVAGYTMATATGVLRVMNNRHWLSDVITGAGIGILTTKFSYWLYSKWENRKRGKQVVLY
ncbi:MAG TPA: phosphatase PAP2 family protein [Chitinophagaceae bacterium]|jgi:membrane-associated phospholipid phosphatase|nr:phosphatase PAP2 family protein [Chitinophagaceae bacterium]